MAIKRTRTKAKKKTPSKALAWAQQRNFLLGRIRSMRDIAFRTREMFPWLIEDLDILDVSIDQLEKRVESYDSYDKYLRALWRTNND